MKLMMIVSVMMIVRKIKSVVDDDDDEDEDIDEEKKLDPNAKESSSLISKHFQKIIKGPGQRNYNIPVQNLQERSSSRFKEMAETMFYRKSI